MKEKPNIVNFKTYRYILLLTLMTSVVIVWLYFYLNRSELFFAKEHHIQMTYKEVQFYLPEDFRAPEKSILTGPTANTGTKALYDIGERESKWWIPGDVLLYISSDDIKGIILDGKKRAYKTSARKILACTYETPWGLRSGKLMEIGKYSILCVGNEDIVNEILDSIVLR